MMFPNLYRLTQTDELSSLGLRSYRRNGPVRGAPAGISSLPSSQPLGCPGSRRNLGVNPGVGEFTTAVVVVFSLAAFLFLCGVCMLLGGVGDTSNVLVFLGVASMVGGIMLTAMGGTLCLKIKRKRNHQEGGVPYYTAVIPADELAVQPPAYTLVDPNSPGLPTTTNLPSPAYTPSGVLSRAPGQAAMDEVSFPNSPPTSPGRALPEGITSPPYTLIDVNIGSPNQDVSSGVSQNEVAGFQSGPCVSPDVSNSAVDSLNGVAGSDRGECMSPGQEESVFPLPPPSYTEAMLQNG